MSQKVGWGQGLDFRHLGLSCWGMPRRGCHRLYGTSGFGMSWASWESLGNT